MTEFSILYIITGSLVGLMVAAFLYGLAGRSKTSKGIRRFGSSFILAATVLTSSALMGNFSWWFLLFYPLLILQFIQGYSDNDGKGWIKRLGITATSCLGGIIFCLVLSGNAWLLLPAQALIGSITVLFAFKNPVYASAEEVMVCLLNNIAFVFYPFIST